MMFIRRQKEKDQSPVPRAQRIPLQNHNSLPSVPEFCSPTHLLHMDTLAGFQAMYSLLPAIFSLNDAIDYCLSCRNLMSNFMLVHWNVFWDLLLVYTFSQQVQSSAKDVLPFSVFTLFFAGKPILTQFSMKSLQWVANVSKTYQPLLLLYLLFSGALITCILEL